MKKLFTFVFLSAMIAGQAMAWELKWFPLEEEYGCLEVGHISANGKYISGLSDWTGRAVIVDIEANETYVFEPNVTELPWVNDSGIAVGYQKLQGGYIFNFNTKEYEQIQAPKEGEYLHLECISDDGTILVGAVRDYDWTYFNPVYRENGEWKNLPVPTFEELGFAASDFYPVSMSSDASVILGYFTGVELRQNAIIWLRQADGSYVCDPISLRYVNFDTADGRYKDNLYADMMPFVVSPDGSKIAFGMREKFELDDDDNESNAESPAGWARYDIATGNLEFCPAEGINATVMGWLDVATGISNDGTVVGHTGGLYTYGMILPADATAPEFLLDLYPQVEEFYYFDYFQAFYVEGITADGKYIAGDGPVVNVEEGRVEGREAFVFAFDTSGGNENDAVEEITTDFIDANAPAVIYNMNGVRREKLAKGFNIVNGSKVVIK